VARAHKPGRERADGVDDNRGRGGSTGVRPAVESTAVLHRGFGSAAGRRWRGRGGGRRSQGWGQFDRQGPMAMVRGAVAGVRGGVVAGAVAGHNRSGKVVHCDRESVAEL
jgi:hypothetical protein